MIRTADDLERDVFQLFPSYHNKELHRNNLAVSKPAYTLDASALS